MNTADWAHINFRAPQELRDWIRRRARLETMPYATLLRRIIREYMQRVDRPTYDAMIRAAREKEDSDGKR